MKKLFAAALLVALSVNVSAGIMETTPDCPPDASCTQSAPDPLTLILTFLGLSDWTGLPGY